MALAVLLAACQSPQGVGTPAIRVSMSGSRLSLQLPDLTPPRTAALMPSARYRVTVEGVDLASPLTAIATGALGAATLEIDGVPGGIHRLITVEPLEGPSASTGAWMAVADVLGARNAIALSAGSTAVGRAWKYWLGHGDVELATNQSPISVLARLSALKSEASLAHFALLDVERWAQAVHDGSEASASASTFAIAPGQVDVTLVGAPTNVAGTLWIDDPASPVQSGISPLTSLSQGRYRIEPVLPGYWTVWASVPGFGVASSSVRVQSGTLASMSISFSGWQPGLRLPVPTGMAAYATDGTTMFVLGGMSKVAGSVTATRKCWELDTSRSPMVWTALPDLPQAAVGATATLNGRQLYLSCGWNSGTWLRSAYVLDLDRLGSWSTLPDVPLPGASTRTSLSYPMGSFADGLDVEVLWSSFAESASVLPHDRGHSTLYLSLNHQWRSDPSIMPAVRTPRQRAGFEVYLGQGHRWAVVAGGDKSLVAEGQSNVLLTACARVEACDLLATTRAWVGWPDLPTPRSALAVAQYGNVLYAAGGVSAEERPLDVVERLDPQALVWSPGPPLRTPRSGFGLLSAGGKLWALGGAPSFDTNLMFNGSARVLDDVETWTAAP